ncbi:MAG: DUF4912 domain-containing protein [Pedosphaera sp.]|nr:DUF4912 domain-containing protein [Pedosphaera sp.]
MKARKPAAKTKKTPVRRPAPARTKTAKKKTAPARKTVARAAPVGTVAPAKKTVRRAKAVKIPAILLEGDFPSPSPVSGPGEKFALGPTPPVQEFEVAADLPEAYGTKRLFLTARDPHWLYANWDLTREQQARCNQQSLDGHLILRVAEAAGGSVLEAHVHPESRHWFVHVESAGAKYSAEVGYYGKGRKWKSIAVSSATITPAETISDDAAVEFATLPADVPFEVLLAFVKEAVRENQPLARALEELRREGHPGLPPVRVAASASAPWTPEQERALAEIVSLDQVRRVWMGSLEITELIRRQFERELASIGAAELSRPTSPAVAVGSESSPFGGERHPGKGFWFNVNAELIIYGATERDATVTIGGRRIKLRADGSFSYRFALPDGKYDLPMVAISADETDGRAAELKFTRTTEYLGEVGAHPQDPALNPPTPDNV